MLALKALSAIVALSTSLASASIIQGVSPLTPQLPVFAQDGPGNTMNVTMSTSKGLITYAAGRLVAGGNPFPTVWTLERNCRDRNYRIFHDNEFKHRNYIQSGDPTTVGSSSYEFRVRFEGPPGSPAGRMYIDYNNRYCLSFDDQGTGRLKYDSPCTPIFFNQAPPAPELSDGMETCS